MKPFVLLLALLAAMPAPAQVCQDDQIEKELQTLADAYVARRLEILDGTGIKQEKIQFVVEHSLAFDYEVEESKTFAGAEQWLRSLETEKDFPRRETRPLDWCRKGLCIFNFEEGISHNTLYIHKVIYGYRNGCPYLKTVFLLNGD